MSRHGGVANSKQHTFAEINITKTVPLWLYMKVNKGNEKRKASCIVALPSRNKWKSEKNINRHLITCVGIPHCSVGEAWRSVSQGQGRR